MRWEHWRKWEGQAQRRMGALTLPLQRCVCRQLSRLRFAFTHMHTHTHTCVLIHTHAYAYTHMHTHTHTCILIHTRRRIHFVYFKMYMLRMSSVVEAEEVHTCIYKYLCTHTHAHTHTHTHTHTHLHSLTHTYPHIDTHTYSHYIFTHTYCVCSYLSRLRCAFAANNPQLALQALNKGP